MPKLTQEIETAIIENATEVAHLARDLFALSTRPAQTVKDPEGYPVAMEDLARRAVQVAEAVRAMEGTAEQTDSELFEVEAMALGISAIAALSEHGVGGVRARSNISPRFLDDDVREYEAGANILASKLFDEYGDERPVIERWYGLYEASEDTAVEALDAPAGTDAPKRDRAMEAVRERVLRQARILGALIRDPEEGVVREPEGDTLAAFDGAVDAAYTDLAALEDAMPNVDAAWETASRALSLVALVRMVTWFHADPTDDDFRAWAWQGAGEAVRLMVEMGKGGGHA